jgi:hypothetical protein
MLSIRADNQELSAHGRYIHDSGSTYCFTYAVNHNRIDGPVAIYFHTRRKRIGISDCDILNVIRAVDVGI